MNNTGPLYCPFCGKPPVWDRTSEDSHNGGGIYCVTKGCPLEAITFEPISWNHRVNDGMASLKEMIAEAAQLIERLSGFVPWEIDYERPAWQEELAEEIKKSLAAARQGGEAMSQDLKDENAALLRQVNRLEADHAAEVARLQDQIGALAKEANLQEDLKNYNAELCKKLTAERKKRGPHKRTNKVMQAARELLETMEIRGDWERDGAGELDCYCDSLNNALEEYYNKDEYYNKTKK